MTPENGITRRLYDSINFARCDQCSSHARHFAPEVKRLIEAAYLQGSENGRDWESFYSRGVTGDAEPSPDRVDWEALLSIQEGGV